MTDLTTDDLGLRAVAATRRTVWTALVGAILLLIGVAAIVATSRVDASAGTPPTTQRVTLRPVTADGHAAAGYRVVVDRRAPIECARGSAVAVDAGIADCGSTADYTPACWASHAPGHVLCLSDPFARVLHSIRLAGAFPALTRPAHASPLGLVLGDGTRYLVRVGGAWTTPTDHPTWVGWYLQRATFAHSVYGPVSGDGINRSHPGWVVTVYGKSTRPGVRHLVDTAYVVGTAR